MKVAVFSTRKYDRVALGAAVGDDIELRFHEARLLPETARLAEGCDAACIFVNDHADAEVIATFAKLGVKGIVTRSAGFNQIDLQAAERHGLPVLRVPAYSPHGVAEHALALMMTLNRRTHRAYNRVREGNFSLEGLMGFEMHGKTVGVIGTGLIGASMCRILVGMGCKVLAHDVRENDELKGLGVRYGELNDLLPRADIVTLHCPLLDVTRNLINAETLARLPDHAMLINTSRGGLVDTGAVYAALRSGRLGALGIDVYEEEDALFFEDRSHEGVTDELIARLVALPNVLITGHQAFFTQEAVEKIAVVTAANLALIQDGVPDQHERRVRPKSSLPIGTC
ncbi:MAG: 2-hydroxyacid dehydrogenase [Planctomycetota bacterium]